MTNATPIAYANGEPQSIECANGVRLNFRIWKRASPEAVLFIHGLGSDQRQFEADAAYFADTGYCAATLDLRGHGGSTAPSPTTRQTLSLDKMADDVGAVLAHIPAPKVHIFGNSLGGLVALKLAEKNAEYLDRIASIITGGTLYRLRMPPGTVVLARIIMRVVGIKRLSEMTAKRLVFNPDARQLVRDLMSQFDAETVHLIQENIVRFDFEDIALNLNRPLLILRGAKDTTVNKSLGKTIQKMAGRPHVKIEELSATGHFTNLDEPKKFRTALLSFFTQIAADAAEPTNEEA